MCNKVQFKVFWEKYGDIIMKLLDGMGGVFIFCVKEGDFNIGVIVEMLIELGNCYCMVQNYLFVIKDGDKCVLVVDGELVFYCLVCILQGGEICGNLVVGGCGEFCLLSESDWEIVCCVGLMFKVKGFIFVGLDIIGDCLMEINVISLICVCEIEVEYLIFIIGMLMDVIEVCLVK